MTVWMEKGDCSGFLEKGGERKNTHLRGLL